MDENADASQAIFEPPPENWRRPPGRPPASLETDVFVQSYILLRASFLVLDRNGEFFTYIKLQFLLFNFGIRVKNFA